MFQLEKRNEYSWFPHSLFPLSRLLKLLILFYAQIAIGVPNLAKLKGGGGVAET